MHFSKAVFDPHGVEINILLVAHEACGLFQPQHVGSVCFPSDLHRGHFVAAAVNPICFRYNLFCVTHAVCVVPGTVY